ncbi:MAG: glycoside hydrolase family 97 protein [Bacteroidota bacterium]
MRFRALLLFITFICSAHISLAQNSIRVNSPDQRIQFELSLVRQSPEYSVHFQGQALIEHSPLSLEFADGLFRDHIKFGKAGAQTLDETYQLVVGKTKTVTSRCNETVIPLEEKVAPFRKINLSIRVFNDGVAFRYEIPRQKEEKSYTLYEECTTFNIVGNPKVLTLYLPSYQSSHEGRHTHIDYQQLAEKQLMDMPLLFEYPNHIFMAVTEAEVRDYAGMYLWKEGGMLHSKLSPKIGQEQIKVFAPTPHHSPWRVLMISDRVGALIESNILTNLNEPCRITDCSWIKPGKTTFTWWNGNMVPDTTFAPGNNFLTNKYYIDFAAANHLQYHAIYGYAEQPWYVDDGFDFGTPGLNADVTRPIKPLDIAYICNYAKSKGVGILLWVNWKALYAKLDDALAKFETWGVSGIMVDFMDRDDQEMINIQEEILAKAARHHLFVQFHGACKPSGLHRTYPNEFTREGTLNYEVYKWDTIINADHDITMPFSRLLAGPTDYHLGGFRAVSRAEFKVQYTRPLVTSTRCHMLAMYVVLESYLHMVADTPASYEGQAGFDFLQKVPTVWDETKVLNASVNEYVTIARKKDGAWFIGALNNSTARTLELHLDFLNKASKYTASIYRDAKDADQHPNHLVKEDIIVTNENTVVLPLTADGGAVIWIRRL